jgi:predicted nucleic acid-binding protein
MTGKVFVDTNVLVYAHDEEGDWKRERALKCLAELWDNGGGRLSTQVLQEFIHSITQRVAKPMARGAAREIVRAYASWVKSPITPATVLRGSEIAETWQTSFWDGMILAAAEQDGVAELLSEDLNAGQIIAGIRIRNPFLAS